MLPESPVFAHDILVLVFDGTIPGVVGEVGNRAFLAVIMVDNCHVEGAPVMNRRPATSKRELPASTPRDKEAQYETSPPTTVGRNFIARETRPAIAPDGPISMRNLGALSPSSIALSAPSKRTAETIFVFQYNVSAGVAFLDTVTDETKVTSPVEAAADSLSSG